MKVLITISVLCTSLVVYSQPVYTTNLAVWEVWWFRLIILILTTLLIYTAYRFRIKQIQQKEKLRCDGEISLNKLENNALRNHMNPHFIFNSLNTINSFINTNDGAKANQYITKFSKLLRLILDYSNQKKITLAEELDVIDLYVQVERTRFENKFDYHINIADNIDIGSIEIPPIIIQPFVENAILHGLLPLKEGGLLQISLKRENDLLICIIEDNGIGRKNDMHNKSLSPAKQHSTSTATTLQRITIFNKEHNVNTPVVVTDLEDATGHATGTRVVITLAWKESF